jgi:nicotinate-nucleotide--dimethylbenzimidazole phosphoribosyltransferase
MSGAHRSGAIGDDASAILGVDAVLFDIGGTLVTEAAPGTAVRDLVPELRPDVADCLRRVAGYHRLGAVTDTAVMDEATVRALLAQTGIDGFLEVVVTSRDVGAAKPDPRGILEACDRLGVAPDRTLFVGDRDIDRDAAANAGAAFVAVDRGLDDAIARARSARTGPFSDAAAAVTPFDDGAARGARARHAQLTKPVGSLGRLEDLGCALAGITRRCPPPVPARPVVAVFAGDHGVAAAGVTPWSQEVTALMVSNFARGGAAINAIARQVGAAVEIIDVGVASDLTALDVILHHKIRAGTDDLTTGPAMTTADARAALDVGATVAFDLVARGHDLLVTGEMGIGNTTPSAALIAAFTRAEPGRVTGRGTGIDDAMLFHKTMVVADAAARAGSYLDPVSILAELGGLEIAALAGFIVAGAAADVPVIIDGVIACAALLAAEALVPGVRMGCLAGHRSSEPGATVALAQLDLEPLLDLDLRLGEGTGACLAVPIVQAAARILGDMTTFDDLGIRTS